MIKSLAALQKELFVNCLASRSPCPINRAMVSMFFQFVFQFGAFKSDDFEYDAFVLDVFVFFHEFYFAINRPPGWESSRSLANLLIDTMQSPNAKTLPMIPKTFWLANCQHGSIAMMSLWHYVINDWPISSRSNSLDHPMKQVVLQKSSMERSVESFIRKRNFEPNGTTIIKIALSV